MRLLIRIDVHPAVKQNAIRRLGAETQEMNEILIENERQAEIP